MPSGVYKRSERQINFLRSIAGNGKGKKHSPEHIAKRLKHGSQHHSWKGDKVGYKSLHQWVRKHLTKPETCANCHTKEPRDVANISQKYLRDLTDWEWLCRTCHMEKDGRLKELQISRMKKVQSRN